ncbi:MAG: transglutaminase-like cysteine peptidase [Vibrio sp.]
MISTLTEPVNTDTKNVKVAKHCDSTVKSYLNRFLPFVILTFILLISVSLEALALSTQEQQMIAFSRTNFGERAALRMKAWRDVTHSMQQKPLKTQLIEVNNFFNQLRFIDDIKLWGLNDYWATPIQFLNVGGGDCEDFSIAKYTTLRELGVADDKLRLIYVKALDYNQFHMVVAYYETPSSIPLILDNLDGDIKPATQRSDLVPIYSFNASNLWITKSNSSTRAGDASKLSSWTNLRNRSKQDTRRPIMNLDQ